MKVIIGLVTEPHRRQDAVRALLWLMMLISLIASMRHVAWVFTTLERGSVVGGWISAAAFDSSIFLLTFLARVKGQRRHERRIIKAGIIANGLITTLANLVYGVEHQIKLSRIPVWLWAALPFVFSAALPLMVIYLAEVLSAEEQHGLAVSDRKAKMLANVNCVQQRSENVQPSVQAGVQKTFALKAERLNLTEKIVQQGCSNLSEIASKVGVSKSTAFNYLRELEGSGRINLNSGEHKPERFESEAHG